jgi:lipoate-protein ligase A
VGNLILDFDYETMSRVLRVSDEKFREKVKKTIRENLRTIRAEFFAGHNFDPPGVTRDDGLAVLKL